jgi:hypothetical protein
MGAYRPWKALAAVAAAALRAGAVEYHVDAASGADGNSGLAPSSAFRTIGRAVSNAAPGDVIHVAAGVYRETVAPPANGTAAMPIVVRGDPAGGATVVSGAEPASNLAWARLATNEIGLPPGVAVSNVFKAALPGWTNLPEIVLWIDGAQRTRLPKAREPDWVVTTPWKHHENWWKADGGTGDRLWDASDDAPGSYPDVQPGNLRVVNDVANPALAGAIVWATDGRQGHDTYRRAILEHVPATGGVRVASTLYGFGTNTKYYVEGAGVLLDREGEWLCTSNPATLYLWPPGGLHPTNLVIEVARRPVGINLRHRSWIRFESLTVEGVNALHSGYSGSDAAIWVGNWDLPSTGLSFDRVRIRDCGAGVYLYANGALAAISNMTWTGCDIGPCDGTGFMTVHEGGPASPGVRSVVIEGCRFHDLGFRPAIGQGIGLVFSAPHRLLFRSNVVCDVMQNGVQVAGAPASLSAFVGNVFERCAQGAADSAGFKVWADGTTASDLLVLGNLFRDNPGWTYGASVINWWETSRGRRAGFGAYVDIVKSGTAGVDSVVFHRNAAVSNGFAGLYVAHSRDVALFNNLCAGNPQGIVVDGQIARMPDFNTSNRVCNNLLPASFGAVTPFPDAGVSVRAPTSAMARILIDRNLYQPSGIGAVSMRHNYLWDNETNSWRHLLYTNLTQIRTSTVWEATGLQASNAAPLFVWRTNGWPALPLNSPAVDAGLVPTAATAMMARVGAALGVDLSDGVPHGDTWDAGPEEVRPTPFDILALEGGTLTWRTVPGARYAVESQSDLAAGDWSPVEFVDAAGETAAFTAPAVASNLHLRVRLQGPSP